MYSGHHEAVETAQLTVSAGSCCPIEKPASSPPTHRWLRCSQRISPTRETHSSERLSKIFASYGTIYPTAGCCSTNTKQMLFRPSHEKRTLWCSHHCPRLVKSLFPNKSPGRAKLCKQFKMPSFYTDPTLEHQGEINGHERSAPEEQLSAEKQVCKVEHALSSVTFMQSFI